MTDAKQNRPDSRAANVDSVAAAKTLVHVHVEHTAFISLPSTTGLRAELVVPSWMHKMRFDKRVSRLTVQKILDLATIPNLRDSQGWAAYFQKKILDSGWTHIFWPDGVAIFVKSRDISAEQRIALYHIGRTALESYLHRG